MEKGVVTLVSETNAEALKLFSFALDEKKVTEVVRDKISESKTEKKRKKYCVKKVCDRCGKAYKGNMGLAIHMSTMHGVKSKKHAPNAKEQKEESYRPISIANKTGGYLS